MRVVNLAQAFATFTQAWSPKVVGDVNDMQVKLVKLRGEFVWHHHDAEDEVFLVAHGRLRMQLRDGDLELGAGKSSSCRAASSTARRRSRTRSTSFCWSREPR